ncbi:glycosyltransferase family 2 protein [Sphingobacterium mizutaii]|uniref:glycosyltransferase family 2 protein n=1 Tax=Sphingobacterium mizutaii TaxID=1010 RepID=UPI001623EB21|nr:glycosyltransferase family 2 protein [Sphingobacterium mizutaii]
MENPLLVTVVVPFYKNRSWLGQALESIQNQTYPAIEVIVVNDGSIEDISDLMEKYNNFSFVKTVNAGAGAARNKGIGISNGDYICFLDSDDLWEKDKIQKQLLFMIKKGYSWSHTDYVKFWDDVPNKKVLMNLNFFGHIIPKLFIYCPIATPCVMIKRSILVEDPNLRFATEYRAGEDSYFWFKIAEKFELGYLPEPLTKVRLRGKNAAYNPLLQLESKSQVYLLIKDRRDMFESNIEFLMIKFGFFLCFLFVSILKRFEHNKKLQNRIAYMFYSIPYIYLKLINKIFSL